MTFSFASKDAEFTPLYIVDADTLEAQPDAVRAWADTLGFKAGLGAHCVVPGDDGGIGRVLIGVGTAAKRARGRFQLVGCVPKLPEGTYGIAATVDGFDADEFALGWLLSGYKFDRYTGGDFAPKAHLIAPEGVDAARLEVIANAESLCRDLINTPTSDLGPKQLQEAFFDMAARFDVQARVVIGDDLLAENFPMIHAVGRASDQAPRLLEMNWGTTGPHITLVGKGVCFDTGGLNIKPGASMGQMKKDMGGAANVIALAQMIMALNLPLRLRVLIPAVENSISAGAYRPGDILTARNGLTVEVNNTDAEGRLVLADALALAAEGDTDCIVSMATLTGAARVAVGADLSPFYSTVADWADALRAGAKAVKDPVWEMPFYEPYEAMIEPGIADLDNAPKGGMGGSITAALFLRRFVGELDYIHFDIYGSQQSNAPARPKGGACQGARAILAALPAILDM